MDDALVVGIIFFSIVAIVKIVSDGNIKKRLIDKGLAEEKVRHLFVPAELSVLSNLKWGMVLFGIGVAALLSNLLPYRWSDEGTFGLILVFAGLGFLIYYPLAQKRLKEIDRKRDQSER